MQHFLKKSGAFLMVVLIGLLLTVAEIQAQQTPSAKIEATSAKSVTIEELKTRREAIENRKDIDATLKADILKYLDTAIADFNLAVNINKQTSQLSELIKAAPERLKTLQAELKKPLAVPQEVEIQVRQMDTLTLEQRLLQEDAALAKAQSKLQEWNKRLTTEKNVITETSGNLANASSRLNEIQTEQAKLKDITEADIGNFTKLLSLKSEAEKLTAEIKLIELRQRSHNLLVELLTLERDVAQKAVESRTKVLNIWQTEVQQRRRQDAVQTRRDAQAAITQTPLLSTVVQDQFDINIELSTELEQITQEEAILTGNYKEHQSRLKALEAENAELKRQLDYFRRHGDSSPALGSGDIIYRMATFEVSENLEVIEPDGHLVGSDGEGDAGNADAITGSQR